VGERTCFDHCGCVAGRDERDEDERMGERGRRDGKIRGEGEERRGAARGSSKVALRHRVNTRPD
jgi:hypothetical protein